MLLCYFSSKLKSNLVGVLFFLCSVLFLNAQPTLKDVFVSDFEPRLNCVFDNEKERGLCGVIPAYFLFESRNATPQYGVTESKNEPILVWHKQCNVVDNNSFVKEHIHQNPKGLMENQLFDNTDHTFSESRTSEAMCNHGLAQYFISVNKALDVCCFNRIRYLVGGLALNYSQKKKLLHESCNKSIQKELVGGLDRSNFISINKHLADVNRKTIQQILNCCLWENILNSKYEYGILVFTLPDLKSKIYVDKVNLNSLSRFNEYGSVLFVQNKPKKYYEEIITHPVQLLKILEKELIPRVDSVNLNKLFIELDSHILNAVLANWQKYETENSLWSDEQQIYHNLIPKMLSDYSNKFEKLISNGNPYYPFTKSKVGFSSEDIINYSPEFQPKVFLMLAAIHKSVIGIATNIEDFEYKNWFAQHFHEEWYNWILALNMKGIHHENYIPLPIHPWQMNHYVERIFSHLIENEILIPLEVTIEVSPTASLRTLISLKNLSAPYIKLPVSIHASTTSRSYPSLFVKAVPILSQFMAKILDSEPLISEKLNILREDVGIYLNTTGEEEAEHLSVTFRENVVSCCLARQEIAVVVAALFEKFPVSNNSLFIHIMQFAGYKTLKGAEQYFTKYVDLVLGSYLDLYLIHGISLEGHQQNTLAVFEHGEIKRFIAKDLGGIDISASIVKSHALLGGIRLSSYFKKNDIFVRGQLLHTVYQSHLGELVLLLADHFNCSENFFWNVIRDKTEERFKVLKDRVDSVRWRTEYDAILKAKWPARSYLQNRFVNEKQLYHFFKNPLN